MARGSVRERGKHKWELTVDIGQSIDPKTGKVKRKRKYKTIEAKGKREAEKKLIEFISELSSDSFYEPESMMFVDFVNNHWKPKYAKKHMANTTLASYNNLLNKRIFPSFQNLKINQVKPLHIVSFLDNLSEKGIKNDGKEGDLSSSTIEYYHRVLRNIFKRAVEWKLIKESPVESVKKPKRIQEEVKVLDDEEVHMALKLLEKESLSWQLIIKLAITSGLRRSEILGLESKHINFEEGTLTINQVITYTKENGYAIDKPKTLKSKRTISFPSSMERDLKKLIHQKNKERLEAEELWRGGNHVFLFSDWAGKPFNPSSLTTWWRRFIRRNNLPNVTLHGLRHTSATFLINQGVHSKIIAERLGHSDIRVTMNIYGHVLKSADKTASSKFDEILNQKKGQTYP